MTKLVRDYIEVADHASLDDAIEMLVSLRAMLPQCAGAELRMKGDDVFGRRLSISFLRPKTAEEAACDARYAHAGADRAPVTLAA
jgi:hypothetical protein